MNNYNIIVGEYMELYHIVIRTVFFYFFVMLCYRIMGKREVGQLGIVDLIVSLLIAELIALSIENIDKTIFNAILPITILVVLEILLAYISVKSRRIRLFFDGKPSLIICNGKINYHEMVKQRYNLDDLLLSLRQSSIKDIEEVEYAFLESNGKLSVFKYNLFRKHSSYPMPIIIDGRVEEKSLKQISKGERWLEEKLYNNGINLEDVFYAFYKNKKLYIIKRDEKKKKH